MTAADLERVGRARGALYDERYAQRYRERDDELEDVASNQAAGRLARRASAIASRGRSTCSISAAAPAATSGGCGTWRRLVGLDASAPMLDEARHPHSRRSSVRPWPITLVHGDLVTHAFPPASFDLVYSIGVLAEHVPLDARWSSACVAGCGRAAGSRSRPCIPNRRRCRARRGAALAAVGAARCCRPLATAACVSGCWLAGMYADERWIASVLAPTLRDRIARAIPVRRAPALPLRGEEGGHERVRSAARCW